MKGTKKKVEIYQNPAELKKAIGKKLMRRRKELGYKNADAFAYETGINRSQYGKYEAGSKDIRVSTLIRVVNALELTIEDFFSTGFEPK